VGLHKVQARVSAGTWNDVMVDDRSTSAVLAPSLSPPPSPAPTPFPGCLASCADQQCLVPSLPAWIRVSGMRDIITGMARVRISTSIKC